MHGITWRGHTPVHAALQVHLGLVPAQPTVELVALEALHEGLHLTGAFA